MFNVFPDKTTLLESPVLISKPLRKNLNIFRLKRFSTRLSGKALFLLLPLHQHYKRPLSLVLSSETQSSKNPAHKCFRRLASSCEFQRNLHLVPGFQRRGQSAYLYIYPRTRERLRRRRRRVQACGEKEGGKSSSGREITRRADKGRAPTWRAIYLYATRRRWRFLFPLFRLARAHVCLCVYYAGSSVYYVSMYTRYA